MKKLARSLNTKLTLIPLTCLFLLQPQAATVAALREWDGGASMNNDWTTPANWVAGAPVAGDDLLFTTGQRHPNNNNDYAGGTTFNSIELRGGGPGAGYNIGGNTIALNAGLHVENNNGQAIDHTVSMMFVLNSNQTFTIINDVGILFLASALNLNGKDLTFNVAPLSEARSQGVISGPGGLSKTNSGTLLLSANNTYTGDTTLDGGTLQVNGLQPASPVILKAGTLKGLGTVGTLTAVGNGGPGSIVLSPGAISGILTCSNVALNASTAFTVELNGGNDYDQLNVNGSVTLNGAALSLSLGFIPAFGTSFTIINNDGEDAVSGTFSGLPQGALFTAGNTVFRITYAGGDGNDVAVSRVNLPPQFTSITKLGDNTVQLYGAGSSNLAYAIQANSNLKTTNWLSIGNAQANGSGQFSFIDTNASQFPVRFYRAVSP